MEPHPRIRLSRDADPELLGQPVDLLPGGHEVEEGPDPDGHLWHLRYQPQLHPLPVCRPEVRAVPTLWSRSQNCSKDWKCQN